MVPEQEQECEDSNPPSDTLAHILEVHGLYEACDVLFRERQDDWGKRVLRLEWDERGSRAANIHLENLVSPFVRLYEGGGCGRTADVCLDVIAEDHEQAVDERTRLGGDRLRQSVELLLASLKLRLDVTPNLGETAKSASVEYVQADGWVKIRTSREFSA